MTPMPAAGAPAPASPGRRHSLVLQAVGLTQIAVFDIAGPIVLYSQLRSAGWSAVTALILSGAFPALGVLITLAIRRRLDALGALVLAGIVVGTLLGLATGSAKATLVEGSVPLAVVAILFLVSLGTARPLMFGFALDFMGAETPKGRDFAGRWRYPGFRHTFRV
ncbi:MAG: VC0807 family protein [Candidatus Dormibacteraceae bacterium]